MSHTLTIKRDDVAAMREALKSFAPTASVVDGILQGYARYFGAETAAVAITISEDGIRDDLISGTGELPSVARTRAHVIFSTLRRASREAKETVNVGA